jgi:glycosyltransferase involved in cell wall biosynthesis
VLNEITPVILTLNEAPNIGRTLSMLVWARDIVVVDSYSADDTVRIARQFSQVRIFERKFDVLARQWEYAITATGISTEWVLALDADYVLTAELVEELRGLVPSSDTSGFTTRFEYCIYGRALRGSTYPPVITLYRRKGARYDQDGHAQRVRIQGGIESLKAVIRHDDRKSIAHWCASQNKYMELEAAKLEHAAAGELNFADRLRRKVFFAPFVMLFYCAFVKGNILDGRAGLFYIFQRTLAEILLSLHLLQMRLARKHADTSRPDDSGVGAE